MLQNGGSGGMFYKLVAAVLHGVSLQTSELFVVMFCWTVITLLRDMVKFYLVCCYTTLLWSSSAFWKDIHVQLFDWYQHSFERNSLFSSGGSQLLDDKMATNGKLNIDILCQRYLSSSLDLTFMLIFTQLRIFRSGEG